MIQPNGKVMRYGLDEAAEESHKFDLNIITVREPKVLRYKVRF